jgi:hypothetical protein
MPISRLIDMRFPVVIRDFITRLCEILGNPSYVGDLNEEWFVKIKYRHHRRLHSRMLGLLALTGHDLG